MPENEPKVLDVFRIEAEEMGGDIPGLTKNDYPWSVQARVFSIMQEILNEPQAKRVGKGVALSGPIIDEKGKEIYIVLKVANYFPDKE